MEQDIQRVIRRIASRPGAPPARHADRISFATFFDASVLLPAMSSKELLLTQVGWAAARR